ncbi:dopamine receptor D4 [Mycolicibacterium wolinskyi]|uniref:dopamine receptor D4 n=1 Tax=Mycolicibacterium wolinskyi TaxID=59750 RepID=UPI000AE87144|nr:dopamine receptor D4 [Mycolicibacterium wolinskyi]
MHSRIIRSAAGVAICCGASLAAVVTASSAAADPAPPPPPAPAIVEPPAADLASAAEGTPHLPSLQNLPPGTTDVPVGGQQGRGVSYLRDIWHAMQTQDVSFNEALFLLTQRPLDPAAPPPPGVAPGPQPPQPPPA